MPSFIFLYILLKNLNFRKRMFSSCVIQILNHLKRRCNHFNFFMFFILCRVNIQIHFYANVRMFKYRLQQNLYWYSYVFPTIPFTNLFCRSNVSASFFCVGFPISDFTIPLHPLQGFFIITSF